VRLALKIYFSRKEEHDRMTAKNKTATKRESPSKPKRPAKSKEAEPAPKVDNRAQKTVVKAIRKNLERKLEKNVKASLADYIRLVQLEKELQQTGAKEKDATWVDPRGTQEIKDAKDMESGK
jgi:hypothetical protein